MSIRKRVLPSGESRWQLDYKDAQNKRRAKQFEFQWQAKEFETKVRGELKLGVHVPDSASATVKEASEFWLKECQGLEQSTLRNYRQHLDLHIVPLIGSVKLSRLTRPALEVFKDRLLETGRSRILTRAVLRSLKALLSEAQKRGLIAQNTARDVRVKMPGARHEKRVAIPTKDEIRVILAKAHELPVHEPWRAIVITALFSGLRSSEIRGLTWQHVDLTKRVIRVRQRADLFNKMGSPKSKAGNRDVPLSPMVINTLRQWRLACPKSDLDLVFPNASGGVIHGRKIRQVWSALLKACDLSGYRFHDLRHAAASLMIEQGWQPKRIMTIMGHSSITMTYDLYGHLFQDAEDDAEGMAQIEARLLLR
jgi:integrase